MHMKNLLLCIALTFTSNAHAQTIVSGYPYTQVPFTSVRLTENSFWGDRLKAARDVTIPLAFSKCETEGRYANFDKAAHPSDAYDVGTFMGFPFDDTDVYKTIEGASYILQTFPDKKLEAYIDSVLDIVAAAQLPDGYLYTARTINPKKPHPWSGNTRWVKVEELSHELYNLGHMLDAAVAHYQATGSRKFLDIARKYADCVVREVGPAEGQAHVVPGHQIAEMGLAKLYLVTGDKRYLDEAKYFLDMRGKTKIHNDYSQSAQPVVDQREAVGHAVRAGYQYAGMADIAALTGDTSYIHAIDCLWENIVGKKVYLTGGVGARHAGEAFGNNYELPNLTAYNETCAAIAQCYLNLRLFMLHGESKYIDMLERTLYNGVISGMSVDGGRFFYPNPLSSDGEYRFNSDNTRTRQPWFGCACCPSNLCRFISSLPGYIYGVKDRSVYINLYAANTANIKLAKGNIELQQVTDYPWNGDIAINVKKNTAGNFTMKLRIPGWVRGEVLPSDLYRFATNAPSQFTITVNNEPVDGNIGDDGYITINRKWKKGDCIRLSMDMTPRMVVANSKVKDDEGRLAIERGPVVYCAEWADNTAVDVHTAFVPTTSKLSVLPQYAINNTEAGTQAFNVVALQAQAQSVAIDKNGQLTVSPTVLTLIPYYAWNHRGAGKMDVWLANDIKGLGK